MSGEEYQAGDRGEAGKEQRQPARQRVGCKSTFSYFVIFYFQKHNLLGIHTKCNLQIEGEELMPISGVCPPADWDGSRRLSSWTPADPQPDLFITATAIETPTS